MAPPTGRARADIGSDLGLDRPALLVVSDGRGDPERVRMLGEAAARGGAWGFYLREPELPARTITELARALGTLGLRVLIADRVDLALASGAFGVELAEHGLPVERARRWVGTRLHLGRSVHDLAGARAAARGGADWLVFGQVYSSPTKPDRPPAGLASLRAVAAASPVPVLAIGGIAPETVREVLIAGARGVAVIGAVAGAADPEAAVRDLQAALAERAASQHAKPKVR